MAKRIERVDIESGDVFGGLKKSAKDANQDVELLSKTLKVVSDEIESVKTKAKGLVIKMNPSNLADIEAQNKAEKEAIRLANERAKLEQKNTQLYEKLVKAKEDAERKRAIQEEKAHAQREKRYNKEIEQANKAGAEYSRFRKELNKLENQYRDLAIQGRETTDEGVKLLNQITKMRSVSDNANNSIRRFNDSVGDYEGSIRRAADALRLEQKQIINNINIVKNQQKTYSQSSVEFRLYQAELNKYETRLKQVNNTLNNTSETTNNFSKSFGKLSGALGVLGLGLGVGAGLKSAFDTIKNFDEANADMAKTLGISTQEASKLSMEFTKLGSVTSIQGLQEIATIGGQFGISAGEIGGFVSSMDKLNVALGSDFGGVEETAKQLGALRNIFTDIKTDNIDQDLLGIGNALNELSSKGAKVEIVSDFANRISGLAIPLGVTSGEVLGLSATLAKLNVNAERGGTAVGTIFQRMTQDARGFAKVAGVSTEEFTNLLNTDMVGAFKMVAKAFDGMKGDNVLMSKTLESLKLTGSGASEVFLKMASNTELLDSNIKLSTESLKEQDSILQEVEKKSSTVGASVAKLGNAWDAWILEVNDGTGAQNGIIAFFDFLSKNLPTIISTVGKLAIGFATFKTVTAVANTDFKELIENFTKFKVEADDAGGKMSGFGNALKAVGWTVAIGLAIELAQGFYEMASGADLATDNLNRLNKAVSEGNKYGGQRVDAIKKEIESGKVSVDFAKQKLQAEIELARESRNLAKQRAVDLANEIEETSGWNIQRRRLLQNQLTAQQEIARREEETIKTLKTAINGLTEEEKTAEKEAVKRSQEAVKQKKTEKETNAIERQKQALKDLADFEQEQIDAEKKKQDDKLARQEEYGQLLEEANKTTREYSMTEMEKELQAVEDKYRRMEDLSEEFLYGQEEILEARLNEENAIRAKYDKIQRDQKKENDEKIAQQEKEALEKRRQERRKFVSDVLDEMKELSQAEEKRIDDRIKAEQDLQNNLQAQANAGNISAQQSIEASREAERKATLEKQKEQRKQQRIEDVKTLLNIINQNIDKGDSVPIATTKGIASLGIIKAVAKGLSGFAKGTEWRLGQEHKAQLSGVDGHIVKVDSSEAIVKGSLMDKAEKAGISSTDELVNLAVMQKMNDQTNGFQPSMTVGYKIDTSGIERRLESIEKAIESKTETQFDPYILNGLAKGIVKTERKGNFTRKTLYKG